MPRVEDFVSPSDAESTSLLILRLNAALDAHLGQLQASCEAGEFVEQRRLFGKAMSALLDIANPLYRAHPHLKPVQLGGPFVVPAWVFEPRPFVPGGTQ